MLKMFLEPRTLTHLFKILYRVTHIFGKRQQIPNFKSSQNYQASLIVKNTQGFYIFFYNVLCIHRQSSVEEQPSKNISSNNTSHIFTLFIYVTHDNPGLHKIEQKSNSARGMDIPSLI